MRAYALIPLEEARAILRDTGGDSLLERLEHLDARRAADKADRHIDRDAVGPRVGDAIDTDVVLAGGGLWSLLAPLLAARGLRVCVVERAQTGQSHREWNASGPELEALVRCDLVDRATLERLVVARYRRGICRFAGGGVYPVRGVLDHAVDAGGLLAHARADAERAGVRFLDGHEVVSHAAGSGGVRIRMRARGGAAEISARVLIDARGASSPYACADLVCPTVGGVLTGLAEGDAPDEVDPATGEILATTDGVEGGRQHVWEAFPGRPGQTTVYLFYYARADARAERTSLVGLYARFFTTLAAYKRGDARLVRPTFGYIPGWSRLTAAPRAPEPNVVLVGDAAARHSPLTYCGFGSALRSLSKTADEVERRIAGGPIGRADDDDPIHALTGALARLMASGVFRDDALNRLLDAAFATLHELGEGPYAALLRDEMRPRDFVAFLHRTAQRHPAVWREVMKGLGPWTAARWGAGVARSLWSSTA